MENNVLVFESYYVCENDIWISARDFNGLFHGDLQSGKTDFIGHFPNQKIYDERLHYGKAIMVESNLYFTPYQSEFLHIFNMKTGLLRSIGLGSYKDKYASSVLLGKKICFMTSSSMRMLVFDCTLESFDRIEIDNQIEGGVFSNYILTKEKCIFSCIKENALIVMDSNMLSKTVKILIGETDDRYIPIGEYKGNILLHKFNTDLMILWNLEKGKIDKKYVMNGYINHAALMFENQILGSNLAGKGITIFDINNLHSENFLPTEKGSYISTAEVTCIFNTNKKIYFQWSGNGHIYDGFGKSEVTKFLIQDDILENVKKELNKSIDVKEVKYIEERPLFTIETFLEYLS